MGVQMGKSEVNAAYGPSWADVMDYMAYFEKEYYKDVHFKMELQNFGSKGAKLFITCFAVTKGKDGPKMGEYRECWAWPHPDCKTMSALYYALLIKLDTRLMRLRGHAEQQASF
jgi:hypothetical protein